ncbi:ADP-ribosyl cyclase/cyclic ADP-ribose hydrolase 1-like [Silurus asotus]|uniref:ADP-ribosyl cyclase/cyclic ADP-ribose hydrolase n=1 Tax=Silurus asotus TaxID=30991 RepID=A0AAD5FL42_SILAS|nr:ADP-ribosyl cyclase/cyclic ADP-ribose hydrolase 1-like [Silurus asotus]
MESEQVKRHSGRNRRKLFVIGFAVLLIVVVVIAIICGVTAQNNSHSFRNVVMERCEEYLQKNSHVTRNNDCKIIWAAFEQAYIGKDPCDVSPEAYDPLIRSVKQDAVCNSMLFWSKTKQMAHAFTAKRNCLVTLEDTLLGFMSDGLTWCSKNKSKETFTTGCPGWSDCQNNPVRSFWLKASINFAATACGNVSVMLNGSLETPFSNSSIFGSVEVKNLDPNKVKGLTVLLVTKDTDVTTCRHPSFPNLQTSLNPNIPYNCREVPYSRVEGCISDPEIPCRSCL